MDITVEGLKEAIDALKVYRDGLEAKKKVFLKRLASIGAETAGISFYRAQYDGYKEVKVKTQWIDDNTIAVVANGRTALFIEFGTGVHYADGYGEEHGFGPGTYGPKGLKDWWVYYGEGGAHPHDYGKPFGKKEGLVYTHGNPPSRSMYEAGQKMRAEIQNIAKEVFG